VALLLRHRTSGAALDADLAEPILLPPGLAQGASNFTIKQVSRHLESNAWRIEQFGSARVEIGRVESGAGRVTVSPAPRPFT